MKGKRVPKTYWLKVTDISLKEASLLEWKSIGREEDQYIS